MKLTVAQIEPYLKQPQHSIYLCYGPNHGLVKERSQKLADYFKAKFENQCDIIKFSQEEWQSETARLIQELCSKSLFASHKILIIDEAKDSIIKELSAYLEAPLQDIILIFEGGDLTPRSTLRLWAEKEKHVVALACYLDQAQDITKLIMSHFQEEQKTIAREALNYLQQEMGEDRQSARRLLEKISIYCIDKPQITLQDVMDCSYNQSALSGESLAFAFSGRNIEPFIKNWHYLIEEGQTEIGLLRIIARHMLRLLTCHAEMQNNIPLEQVFASLKPPVFFMHKKQMMEHLRLYTLEDIIAILSQLTTLEQNIKTHSHLHPQTAEMTLLQMLSAGQQKKSA